MNPRKILLGVVCGVMLPIAVNGQTVQSLKLVTNHIISDPVSGMIYASVPSSVGTHGNSIATVNPSSGTVVRRVFVGSEPDVLAASDDGQFVYVGLDGAEAVRRYVIATHRAGLQFSLGGFNAQDLKVLPGSPRSVAVLASGTVAIYDNGVPRPNVASGSFGSLALSGSAAVMYAQDTQDSLATFGSSMGVHCPRWQTSNSTPRK
ncbi:MAG: YncE family protein [Chthoniobacterales bacterium]